MLRSTEIYHILDNSIISNDQQDKKTDTADLASRCCETSSTSSTHTYNMSSYTFSRASSDSSSSTSSSSSSSSSFQSSYSMEPRVEVMRCSRCAKTVETISTMQYQGNELRRVSTDDASANGMVRFGHNLYYCDRCAKMVGYKWSENWWRGFNERVQCDKTQLNNNECTGLGHGWT